MAILKAKYATQDDIPENHRDLYEERGEEWLLKRDAIDGIKTEADVQRVQRALNKASTDLKEAKSKLDKLGDRDIDEVLGSLDEIEELRAKVEAGDNKDDDAAIQKRIDAAVAIHVNPLKRKLEETERERDSFKTSSDGFSAALDRKEVETAIQTLAVGKVEPTAMEDLVRRGLDVFEVSRDPNEPRKVTLIGKTGSDYPGAAPKEWLPEILDKYPHYAPRSVGGGAGGSNGGGPAGSNPFTKAGWNKTAQYALPPDKREQMAKQAGFASFDAAMQAGAPIEKQ